MCPQAEHLYCPLNFEDLVDHRPLTKAESEAEFAMELAFGGGAMWWRIRREPRVVVICPGCGRQIKKRRERLERDHSLCCPACHLTFRPEPFEAAITQTDAEVSEKQD
jgi:hypothetical protein